MISDNLVDRLNNEFVKLNVTTENLKLALLIREAANTIRMMEATIESLQKIHK